jgi:hypothetical protein
MKAAHVNVSDTGQINKYCFHIISISLIWCDLFPIHVPNWTWVRFVTIISIDSK